MAKQREYKTTLSIHGKVDKSLNKALKAAESGAAKVAKNISSGLSNTVSKAGNMVKTGIGTVAKTLGVTMVAGATAATVALGALGTTALNNAAQIQKEMQNVATLLDGTEQQVSARTKELTNDVLKVSSATGIASSDLTAGLYDVISAVGDTKDSISILETASKAAAAGNATTSEAVSLLTAVTKGYGDTTGEAFSKASDLAFQTVKLGQTTFPELAASIGKVTPLASALGVEQEELFGVFATLTGVTGSAAEVATQYKGVLAGLMSPSENMANALSELGYSTGTAAIEALGFQGVLNELMKSTNGDVQATAKLFSSVEAQTAVLSLCGAQTENLTNKTKAMYEAQGIANKAFETQSDNLPYMIQRIKNLGTNFLTSVGTKMMPYVLQIAETLMPKIESGLSAILPVIDRMIETAGPGFAAMTEKMEPFVSQLIQNIPGAISKIAEIGSSIYKILEPPISKVAGFLMPLVSKAIENLPPIIDFLAEKAKAIYDFISPFIEQIIVKMQEIAPVVQTVILQGISYVQKLYQILAPIVQTIVSLVGVIISALLPVLSVIWNAIGKVIDLLHSISPIINFLLGKIGEVASFLVGGLSSAISFVIDIGGDFLTFGKSIIEMWKNVLSFFSNVFAGNWKAAWENIVGFATNAFSGLKTAIGAVLKSVIAPINVVIRGVNKVVQFSGGKKIPELEVPGFALGTTVTKPTLAMVGEGRYPETIIPHTNTPRSRALLSEATKGVYGNSSGGGKGKTVNIVYAPVIHSGSQSIRQELEENFEKFKGWLAQHEDEDDREVFA